MPLWASHDLSLLFKIGPMSLKTIRNWSSWKLSAQQILVHNHQCTRIVVHHAPPPNSSLVYSTYHVLQLLLCRISKVCQKNWHWTKHNSNMDKEQGSIQSCRYTTLALGSVAQTPQRKVAMGGRLMLIHILTLMMMFMVNLMTLMTFIQQSGQERGRLML